MPGFDAGGGNGFMPPRVERAATAATFDSNVLTKTCQYSRKDKYAARRLLGRFGVRAEFFDRRRLAIGETTPYVFDDF
jgi:hypothetical protein